MAQAGEGEASVAAASAGTCAGDEAPRMAGAPQALQCEAWIGGGEGVELGGGRKCENPGRIWTGGGQGGGALYPPPARRAYPRPSMIPSIRS